MDYWRDKVTLVTGGSAGFGRELAFTLARRGAVVVLADLDAQGLQQCVDEMSREGLRASGYPADMTSEDQVETLVQQAVSQHGRLDMMANIVGRSARGNLLETEPQTIRDMLEVNFLSTVHGTRAAARHLIETRGHLVNMASLAAKSAARYLGAYAVSKFPVAAFSQQLRYELGPQGVHVLLVCPGPMTRADAGNRYDHQATELPEEARKPGAGVRVKGIPPDRLAAQVLRACEKRRAELVVPVKARLLFALQQLWPRMGDRLLLAMTTDR
jgi:short-subunit dehydrogenase